MLLLSICRIDGYLEVYEKQLTRDPFECCEDKNVCFKKSADGTLAGFPAVTVASVSSRCNWWWLQFCPLMSRCRRQQLRPVISLSCKPENQKPTSESWRVSVRKKKQLRVLITCPFFLFCSYCISSFLPLVALITYNLLSLRSSAIRFPNFWGIFGFPLYDHGEHGKYNAALHYIVEGKTCVLWR